MTTRTKEAAIADALKPADAPKPLPGTDLAPLRGGGSVAAIIPQNLTEITMLASMIAEADWAPKSYRLPVPKLPTGQRDRTTPADEMPYSPAKIAVGIMHGMELNLKPIQALQAIAVINGMPSIYGDAALAVVRASGLLLDFEEVPIMGDYTAAGEQRGETLTFKDVVIGYECRAVRKGQETPIVQRFTIVEARKAGLWGKEGPWTNYPQRMFQMRARSWCLRDAFPDVLKGLPIFEEAIDVGTVQSQPVASNRLSSPGRRSASSALDAAFGDKDAGFEESVETATAGNATFDDEPHNPITGEVLEPGSEGDLFPGDAPSLPTLPEEASAAAQNGSYKAFFAWSQQVLDSAPELAQRLVNRDKAIWQAAAKVSDNNRTAVMGLLARFKVIIELPNA